MSTLTNRLFPRRPASPATGDPPGHPAAPAADRTLLSSRPPGRVSTPPLGGGGAAREASGGTGRDRPLVAALVVAAAYAAFAHGAIAPADAGPLEAGLAVVVALYAAWVLVGGGPWPATTRASRLGLTALALFAAWCGLSLLWSVAPDRSWLEFDQALGYLLVLGLGLAAGSAGEAAVRRITVGVLAVAVAVAAYALGGKVAPGLSVAGLIDLNHTADVARLRAPLDYWNALGLVCALAAPIALRLAVEHTVRARRAWALVALSGLVVCGALTYSRGAVLALVVALAVSLRLGGSVARSLGHLAIALAGALPAVALGFADHRLVAGGVDLGSREAAGAVFGLVLAVSLAAVWLAGHRSELVADRLRLTVPRQALLRRAAAVTAAGVIVLGLGVTAASSRGLTGTISHDWHSFTVVREDKVGDPGRLLTANSGNRWVWWQEALGAFSDRPVAGWGAGSFPVTHLLYRHNTLEVLQPHNVELQFLAEDGVVGALLVVGGLVALGGAALGAVRRLAGPERGLAAAAAGAGAAWAVHGVFDWDWDIPGVTVAVMALVGVLAGRGGTLTGRLMGPAPDAAPPGAAAPTPAPGSGGRGWALGAVWVGCLIFVVSALLPALAQSEADAALASLPATPTPAQLRSAAARAELAAQLDPLAVAPVLNQSAIAERRGERVRERSLLLEAVARQPYSEPAWAELARVELLRLDLGGSRRAAAQALRVDPRNPQAAVLAAAVEADAAPPSLSATATGTPLPLTPVGTTGGSGPAGRSGPSGPSGPHGPGVTSGPASVAGATGRAVASSLVGPFSRARQAAGKGRSGRTGFGRSLRSP